VSEARALAREIDAGLESGDLEPTAAALEPLADQPRKGRMSNHSGRSKPANSWIEP
jgi:hypothetical protein